MESGVHSFTHCDKLYVYHIIEQEVQHQSMVQFGWITIGQEYRKVAALVPMLLIPSQFTEGASLIMKSMAQWNGTEQEQASAL